MAKKSVVKGQSFNVLFKVTLELERDIPAPTFEAALDTARKLGVLDLVSIKDAGHMDSSIGVTGVFETDR